MIEIEGNDTPKDTEENKYFHEEEVFAEEPEFWKQQPKSAEKLEEAEQGLTKTEIEAAEEDDSVSKIEAALQKRSEEQEEDEKLASLMRETAVTQEVKDETKAVKKGKRNKETDIIQSLKEYKDKLLAYRTKKWMRYIGIALTVLVIVLAIGSVVRNWKYDSYSVIFTDSKEDTLSFNYCGVGQNLLKYGIDSAMMADRKNSVLWNVSYSMQSPDVAICGNTVAIYDRNGTNICICDETGQIGSVSANMPIVKATVAKQGVVAAIMEDGENTWIQYYDQFGKNISSIKTTMDSPGYPMDLSLSQDGTLLAVSYLYYENGVQKDRVYFYNFGSVGQNQMDNRVSGYEYRNILIPQVEYLDNSTCVVFREDGVTIFSGAQIPEESKEITVDQEIISTFYNDSYIGFVLKNGESEQAFRLMVYNKKGKEILSRDTNFAYQTIEIVGNQIVMYNKSAFCVYSLAGVEKFSGSFPELSRQFFSIGQNRYVLITEDGFNLIKLG